MIVNPRKIKFIKVGLLITLFFVPGSTSSNSSGLHPNAEGDDVVIYALPSNFTEYSYFTSTSSASDQWLSSIFIGLVILTPEGDWIPDLAKTVETRIINNKQVFTFLLREDLRFSNGHHLTTSDVAFSLSVSLTPAINKHDYDKYEGYLDNSSYSVIDDLTIEIWFDANHTKPYDILFFPIIDEEYSRDKYSNCLEGINEDCIWDDDQVKGAGPFSLSDKDHVHQIVTVVANPFYFIAARVWADKIIFQKIGDRNVAISALATGLIDILDKNYYATMDELELEGVGTVSADDQGYWGYSEDLEGVDFDLLGSAQQDWSKVKGDHFLRNSIYGGPNDGCGIRADDPPCIIESEDSQSNQLLITSIVLFSMLGINIVLFLLVYGRKKTGS